MKTFGKHLNHLLTIKKINKSKFAKSIHIQRSTLYKYLDGTSIPDEEFFKTIQKELSLTKDEFSLLDEAYQISKYGKGTLKNRQAIYKMLHNMNAFYKDSLLSHRNNINLTSSTYNLPHDLKIFLNKLLASNDTEYSKIILNTNQVKDVTELIQFIISEIYESKNESLKNVEIEHIFHYKNIKYEKEYIDNLEFLSNISTLIPCYERYQLYFYSVTYSQNNYDIFPNTLLINNTIIYISNDFNNWFYINDQNTSDIHNIISCFYKEFNKAKLQTNPLIRVIRDMASYQEFIVNIENRSVVKNGFRKDLSCFAPPPNMTLNWFEFNSNLIDENYLKILIDLHNDRLENFSNKLTKGFKYFCVSSLNSVSDFLIKGRIYDQGEYPTFKIHARIKIVMNLLNNLCMYDDYNLFFIKEDIISNFSFIDKIQFFTNDNNILISICDENSEICKKQPFVFAIVLDSSELTNCFNDYIYSLTRNMTFSKEESILLIKNALDNFALKNNIQINYEPLVLNYIKRLKI